MKLYFAVTADKYELPLVVEDSAAELAKKTGYKRTNILSELSKTEEQKSKQGNARGIKFVRVEVDDG